MRILRTQRHRGRSRPLSQRIAQASLGVGRDKRRVAEDHQDVVRRFASASRAASTHGGAAPFTMHEDLRDGAARARFRRERKSCTDQTRTPHPVVPADFTAVSHMGREAERPATRANTLARLGACACPAPAASTDSEVGGGGMSCGHPGLSL